MQVGDGGGEIADVVERWIVELMDVFWVQKIRDVINEMFKNLRLTNSEISTAKLPVKGLIEISK